jgi:hypothetical protein
VGKKKQSEARATWNAVKLDRKEYFMHKHFQDSGFCDFLTEEHEDDVKKNKDVLHCSRFWHNNNIGVK